MIHTTSNQRTGRERGEADVKHPNILFFMVDQMQGRVLEADHRCQTPNLDRLAARGVRFSRAYTPNAICSPARASLMTGTLPHTHGVWSVTHTHPANQLDLDPSLTHWAQRLKAADYRTSYFGKWHVEQTDDPTRFGWDTAATLTSAAYCKAKSALSTANDQTYRRYAFDGDGYPSNLFYEVNDTPPASRRAGVLCSMAEDYLDEVTQAEDPWCCFVSCLEPHDPFVCGKEAFDLHFDAEMPLPENASDPCLDKPALYRRVQRVFGRLTAEQQREAAACYWGVIHEVDQLLGRLLAKLEQTNQLDNTLIVFTSDHGELLGGHGLYTKNIGAFEEVYNIPMVVAGPGVARGEVCEARLGLHDLCPTLCDLAGVEGISHPDSRSMAHLLRRPAVLEEQDHRGYAEFSGTRYLLTQRIVWDGDWKLVHNGFDEDELYHLGRDPGELNNLIGEADCSAIIESLYRQLWERVQATDDVPLTRLGYSPFRIGAFGPSPLPNPSPSAGERGGAP